MNKRLLLMSLGAFLMLSNGVSQANELEKIPKLTVKGEASIFKPADQMEVSLGVVSSAEESAQAMEINNQHIRQVIANLKTLGLDETDFQTGHFHVKPIYQKLPKEAPDSDHGKISHYEALNTIQVKTQKISLADQIINAAIQGGANQITQVNFNLNNPQAYRGEAIKLAAQNGLSDANALAAATEVKLHRILNLSLDHWHSSPQPYMMKAGAQSLAGTVEQEVIEPGQTEIHAVVNITFEIGS